MLDDILMIVRKIIAFPFYVVGMLSVMLAFAFMSIAMFITGEKM